MLQTPVFSSRSRRALGLREPRCSKRRIHDRRLQQPHPVQTEPTLSKQAHQWARKPGNLYSKFYGFPMQHLPWTILTRPRHSELRDGLFGDGFPCDLGTMRAEIGCRLSPSDFKETCICTGICGKASIYVLKLMPLALNF